MTPALAGASAVMPTYARFPLTLVRGQGVRVTDDEGRTYLDAVGGLGALALGHAHPRWVAAVEDAARTLGLTSNLFSTPPQAALAARLAGVVPLDDAQVFFCNSGTEANEALLKLVRKHGLPDGRGVVVALEGSFHGRTIGSLAATGQPAKRAAFEPLIDWIRFVPPGDEAALTAALAPGDVAAVLLEPVLGEGGVIPLSHGYLRAVRAACDAHGALLAVDEVQAGTGRCGAWCAIELAGVRPDVISLAKALGGGLPIGALVAPAPIAFEPGDHASTFGGGPVPSSAALSVLDTIEDEGLLARVTEVGARLRARIAELAPAGTLVEVRGEGQLTGAQLAPGLSPDAVLAAMRARGVLASQAGPDAVRFTPPYVLGPGEADEAAAALAGALEEVAA